MNISQNIISNILTEKASIDWNNYLTPEEVNKFLSKDDKVESAEEIVYNTKGNFYQKYFDKFKDEGWTKRELTQDLSNFYNNHHLNEKESNKDSRIKYGPYKDAMGMWTIDLADGYITDSGDSFIQEKTKKECLRMLDTVVNEINESIKNLSESIDKLWISQMSKKSDEELSKYLDKLYKRLSEYNDKEIKSTGFYQLLDKINYLEDILGIKPKLGRVLK